MIGLPKEAGAVVDTTLFHDILFVACKNGVYFTKNDVWGKLECYPAKKPSTNDGHLGNPLGG